MNGYNKAILLLQHSIQCIPLNEFKTPKLAFKDVTIDKQFIDDNRQAYEYSQCLGALTRNIWCIDIDCNHTEHENGFKSLATIPYYDELDKNAMDSLIQATPTGGMHIIFKKNTGIDYSQKIGYLEGIDIKANENNYFVYGGSVTQVGIYQSNGQQPIHYSGDFEKRIFGSRGTFRDQIMEKYSVKNMLPNYDFSHLESTGKGGLGKQAYQRIIDGVSIERNNDLFLAVSYAKACNIDIEPLRVLINDMKGNDRFTESEFEKTVESALRG